jgi:hypothetical protein
VFGTQDEVIGMPLGQYGSRLSGSISIGGSLLPITDAADVPYRVGGFAIVWRDAFTWELFTVSGTSGAGVATSDTSAAAWASGSAIVMPVRTCRISDKSPLRWESSRYLSGRVRVSMEQSSIGTAIGTPATPTNYKGFDVLEVEPSRDDGIVDEFDRKVFLMDTTTGTRAAEATDANPSPKREVAWLTFARAEARALREFVDRRKGRAVPFWHPAWEEDLTLTVDHGASSSALVVKECGYASRLFAAGPARRNLAIRAPGAATRYRGVLSAVDNLNGTETIVIDSPVPEAMPAEGTLIAFLRFARMEDDKLEIEWNGGAAAAQLGIRDLPAETPV